MKTLTEFSGFTLQDIGNARAQLLKDSKTPEEISLAISEQFKLEGDKLTLLLAALDSIDNRVRDLKRVVVGTLAEGEKLPPKAVQKEDKVFVAEYFPPLNKPKGRFPANDRDDRKRGGGKRGDGKRAGRGGPRPDSTQEQRPARKERPPREERAASPPPAEGALKIDSSKDAQINSAKEAQPALQRRRPPRGRKGPGPGKLTPGVDPKTGEPIRIKIKPLLTPITPVETAATSNNTITESSSTPVPENS